MEFTSNKEILCDFIKLLFRVIRAFGSKSPTGSIAIASISHFISSVSSVNTIGEDIKPAFQIDEATFVINELQEIIANYDGQSNFEVTINALDTLLSLSVVMPG